MRRCEEWELLRWSPSSHHIWPGLIRTTQKGTKHHKSWKPPEGATSLFPVSVLLCEISCWRLRDVNVGDVGDVSWQKLTRAWCLTISSISHLPPDTNLAPISHSSHLSTSSGSLGSEVSQSSFNYKIYLIRSAAERRSGCLACLAASQTSPLWWMTWGFCLVIGIINFEFFAQYSFKFGPNN